MDASFTCIKAEDITQNTFKLIGSEWMLITAGPKTKYNTMTASWGGFGVIWMQPVCWCVIRPGRHTIGFVNDNPNFTLSFFDKEYRPALELCGSKSGRDIDKAAATGLTPIECDLPDTTAFAQARMIIECKKNYFQDIDPANFLDPGIEKNYPIKDYHRMFFGAVERVWIRK